jgi:HAE1 family hydrophobic/amphiphilic exporter-1
LIRLTQLAVAKRSVTILITLGLLFGGLFAWSSLKQELLPDISLPFIVVITPMPGASAQDVATQVTQPVERSIGSVPRLSHIDSSSVNSLSIVVASFSYGTNVKDTKAAVDASVKTLGLTVTSDVESFDINSVASLTVAIQGTNGTTQAQLNDLATKTIVPSLAGIDGVAKVSLTGAAENRLVIGLDPVKMAANGVTIGAIQGTLAANNLILPAGSMPSGSISIPVSAQHEIVSKDEIANLLIFGSAPSPTDPTKTVPSFVKIGDIATVDMVASQPTGYAQINGSSSLVLGISKTSDGNTVDVSQAVRNRLEQLGSQAGGQFSVTIIQDYSSFIIESRDSLVREGGLGALFAIITIFIFLMSLRSTLVAAVSIPVSIMTALLLMLVAGVTINIMTLGGLAVAVGRVVDDAIVVLENIYRHRGRGDSMREAVVSGTREVASAITSSTLTTVAVFLPLGFVGGIVSQFFLPFALTVTFALLASLVCALTVVPVMASLFIDRIKLNPDAGSEHRDSLVQRIYTPLLRAALHSRRSRWGVLAVAAFLVLGAGALVPSIPTQFINAGSEKYLSITVTPPSGTPSSVVLEKAQQLDSVLKADGKINLIETTVPGDGDTGLSALSAAFSGGAANAATVTVRLDPSTDLDAEQKALATQLNGFQADGWLVQVAQQSLGGSGGSSMSVVISGADPDKVATATTNVMAVLKTMPDLINVKSDLATAADEIQVNVDPNKALMAGTSTVQVQGEIHNILVGTKAGTVYLATGPADVYLQVAAKNSAGKSISSVDDLKALLVGAAKKPLGDIATVAQVKTQARISRVDQAPAATITADSTSKNTGGVSIKVQKELDKLAAAGQLTDVTVTLSGVTEQMNSAFGGLFLSMGVAILLVYIVMVLVFNSLVDPLVIMFSLPLATIGAFPALFLTQRAIGISALIGFLMLIGIVVTNAIVLLDLVEQHRRRGMPMYEALMQGGRTRVRPILMTAIATMLALMPLALGLSQGEIIASELATVVIGGLFSSTFLTLIIVPVVYSLVDDAKVGGRRRLGLHDEEAELAVD